MSRDWTPHVSRKGRTTQMCYDLPHRINVAKAYPVKTPNGSTITVYGHSDGLTLLWKGCYPSEKSKTSEIRQRKSNGTTQSYKINSNLDQSEADLYDDEDEEDEEQSSVHEPVTHHLDICLGAEILDISFPPIPSISSRSANGLPSHLTTSIFVTATCSGCKVVVIRVPLEPIADEFFCAEIPCTGTPCCTAITWTAHEQMEESELLVAICFKEANPRLTVTRIPLAFESGSFEPFQEQYLQKAAHRIAFNPSLYPSSRHTQIILSHPAGSVSIYDPFSTAEQLNPQTLKTEEGIEPPSMGHWLAVFTSPFEAPKLSDYSAPSVVQRKPIVDAQWVCDGRSILTLLSDGEWGIWDFDGGSPDPSASLGTALTPNFDLRGFIGSNNHIVSQDVGLAGPKKPRGSRSSLAPMTPNSRSAKAEELFRGQDETAPNNIPSGGISVFANPSESGHGVDESVILWYKNTVYTIPSVQSFWSRTAKSSRNSRSKDGVANGGSLYGPGLTRVEGLQLYGERVTSVSQLPGGKTPRSSDSHLHNLIISAEHRLLFVSTEASRADIANATFENRLKRSFSEGRQLLAHTALDLGGLDRVLDDMIKGHEGRGSLILGREDNATGSPTKKVGFAA